MIRIDIMCDRTPRNPHKYWPEPHCAVDSVPRVTNLSSLSQHIETDTRTDTGIFAIGRAGKGNFLPISTDAS